ncbi:MAG: NAD(P)-dependent oxidoreductase [Paracoccaceae bacterium]
MKSFPVFLGLAGARVVIVGGSEEAAQKFRLFARTEAAIDIVAPVLCDELRRAVMAGRARQVPRVVSVDAFLGARLAIVCTGCAGADGAAAALARAVGVLVNVVDRPDLCDVTTPALVDRDPVVVAIGTEGTAPVLSRQIKSRVEAMLEPDLGAFAAFAGRLREQVAYRVAPARRRAFWDWAFDGPRRLFTSGARAEAEARIDAALSAGAAPGENGGRVTLVAAERGGADLIPLRAVQRLQSADLLIHDPDAPWSLLELARRDAERAALTGEAAIAAAEAAAAEGRSVVLVGPLDLATRPGWERLGSAPAVDPYPLPTAAE